VLLWADAPDDEASNAATATGIAEMEKRTLERRGLIDEHDGDVIAHRIPKLARMTNEARFRFAVFEVALAFGADEDFEKLCVEAHDLSSCAM
jgi:hypothetical protein